MYFFLFSVFILVAPHPRRTFYRQQQEQQREKKEKPNSCNVHSEWNELIRFAVSLTPNRSPNQA